MNFNDINDRKNSLHNALAGVSGGLTDLRRQIADKMAEIEGIQSALIPASEARERFVRYLERRKDEAGFEHRILAFFRPKEDFLGKLFNSVSTGEEQGSDAEAAIVYLLKDQLLTAFDNAAQKMETGLLTTERNKRVGTLKRELYDLEVVEESMICQVEELGLVIDRRGDARPEIVLEWQD